MNCMADAFLNALDANMALSAAIVAMLVFIMLYFDNER